MLPSAAARALLVPALLAAGTAHGAAASPVARPHPQETGRALAAELGCGACHAGMPSAEAVRARAPAFGAEGAPLAGDFIFTYLADPVRRREDIGASRMPDFGLDEAERVALALLLGSPGAASPGGALAAARERFPRVDRETGRRIFGALGCAGCHAGVDGLTAIAGPDLSREGARVRADWLRGFLARPTAVRGDGHPTLGAARMPDFRLTGDEAAALASWLDGLGARFASLDTTALTPFTAQRTRRMLEDRVACLGCHQVGDAGGGIGPSLDGLGERLEPAFVLEVILDPGRAAPGSPMPHQPMPAREAARLARYLLDLAGAPRPLARISLAEPDHPGLRTVADTTRGARLYARHCTACHGAQGRGDGWNAASLPVPPAVHADAARMSARPDDTLFDGIWAGAWVLDGSPRMPAFGGLLDAGEVRDLVAYIRNLCSCIAPAWSRDGRREGP
jgi:mono/diheme cytochrome c family protein